MTAVKLLQKVASLNQLLPNGLQLEAVYDENQWVLRRVGQASGGLIIMTAETNPAHTEKLIELLSGEFIQKIMFFSVFNRTKKYAIVLDGRRDSEKVMVVIRLERNSLIWNPEKKSFQVIA